MDDSTAGTYLEDTLKLPCPSCGSELHYSAKHQKIVCDYCGYQEELDRANDKVVEQSLARVASGLREMVPEQVGKRVFDCDNCGAKMMLESDRVKVQCGFCGSQQVNLEAYDHQLIQPIGIIPFYISREEAEKIFTKWVQQGWFHPNGLKRFAAIETLHGIYIPFWTYDAKTESQWSGQAGYYYYVTKRVRQNGKMVTKQVRKTRWKQRSGRLSHFFDDVLVIASHGLSQKKAQKIMPYRLEEVVNYDPRLLVGWEAELYQLQVEDGYQMADQIMDGRIRQMCSAQLGGDTQRNLRVSTQKSAQTFKHLVLPLWICSYAYNGKDFQFYINGQTGKIHGKKPVSALKIALLVIVIALFIAGIIFFAEYQKGQ
ncbi:MAG: hypothetical protein AAF798_08725 [Bacteroidota bacterium]